MRKNGFIEILKKKKRKHTNIFKTETPRIVSDIISLDSSSIIEDVSYVIINK